MKISLLTLMVLTFCSIITLTAASDTTLPIINLAIFVSGTGSNMAAILDKKIDGIKPCIVISNKKDIPALQKAKEREVPTEVIISSKGDKESYSKRLIACLKKYEVTPDSGLICLAGFMKILDEEFVNHFKDRILNIHPSLLPAFPGLDAIGQAFNYGVKIMGCTVHFVDAGVDTGAIVTQEAVEVQEDDTRETLEKRMHEAEHRIYPRAIELFAQGKLIKQERKVKVIEEKQEKNKEEL